MKGCGRLADLKAVGCGSVGSAKIKTPAHAGVFEEIEVLLLRGRAALLFPPPSRERTET